MFRDISPFNIAEKFFQVTRKINAKKGNRDSVLSVDFNRLFMPLCIIGSSLDFINCSYEGDSYMFIYH
jgi:hypothetical protein